VLWKSCNECLVFLFQNPMKWCILQLIDMKIMLKIAINAPNIAICLKDVADDDKQSKQKNETVLLLLHHRFSCTLFNTIKVIKICCIYIRNKKNLDYLKLKQLIKANKTKSTRHRLLLQYFCRKKLEIRMHN
jgi:hypothetical protein